MKFWLGYLGSLASMIFSQCSSVLTLDPPRFRSQPQLSVRWIVFYWWFGMGKEETPEMEIVVCQFIFRTAQKYWIILACISDCVCICFLDLSKGCSFVVLEVLYLQKLIDTSGMFVATTGILSCFQWFAQLMMSWNDLVQSIILESKITLYNHYTKKNRIQRSIWPTKKIYNTGFHYPLQSGFWNRTWNRHPYESTRILIWYRWWKKSQTTTLDV